MRAQVNGVELYFDVHGAGLGPDGERLVEKPAVLVLHGGPGLDHTTLVPWLAPLTADCQLVYLDHRGHGRSSRPPPAACTLEAMADDVEGLRRHLGLADVTVLGVSFGGMVALTHALRHPGGAARLILCATAPSREFVDEARRLARERATPEQLAEVEHVLAGTFRDDAHFREGFARIAPLYQRREAPASGPDRTIVNAAMLNWFFATGVQAYDVRPRLREITAPTLVLTGRHDWICPPSQSAVLLRELPDVRQVMLEASGHRLQREENELFVRVVREFVLTGEVAGAVRRGRSRSHG